MTTIRRLKTREYLISTINCSSFHRLKKCFLPLFVSMLYVIRTSTVDGVSIPENESVANQMGSSPSHQKQQQEQIFPSKHINSKDKNGGDDNNGIIQIIESEVWDASEGVWKGAAIPGAEGANRWTNDKGHGSPSPAELVPPDGWDFLGDWKIVVSSTNNNSVGIGGGLPGGDSKGWEYQFQYLQPPRRRRIWLRSLTPKKLPLLRPKSGVVPSQIVKKLSPPIESVSTKAKIKKTQRSNRFIRTIHQIRDNWNYKGLGFNLYKSLIFPSSIGVAIRLPLSINFDTFDRNPAWPIISSSAAVFYPPMMAGFLTTSVHVEWVKWIIKCTLGLVPRSIFWALYKIILPVIWMVASVLILPLKGVYTLPPCPTKIPDEFWWTGRKIMKPQYNSEMSERIGCSVSYRWSKKRGYEWRVTYWHLYLPTLSVYQQFLSQLHERLKGSFSSGSSSTSPPLSTSPSSSASQSAKTQSKAKTNWWRKHTASLGVSTGGPIPDTPPISCTANLSLAGLYLGAKQIVRRTSLKSSTIIPSEDPRTSGMMPAMGDRFDNTTEEADEKFDDRSVVSNRVRTSPIKTGPSLS